MLIELCSVSTYLAGLHQALRDCTGPLLDNICVMNKNAAMRHALLEFSLKPFDTDTDGFVDEFCRYAMYKQYEKTGKPATR